MSLRDSFIEQLKTAMLAKDAARVSILRMITARLKDADIAARPGPPVDNPAVIALLRGMVKSRRESVLLYQQGNRPELAAKEEAEIGVIEGFLPAQVDDAALRAAIQDTVGETGAASVKDMGRVMAVLKTRFGAELDMGRAGPLVRTALGG